jgi:hypothetical protein
MKKHFEYLRVTRNNVLKLIENLDLAQLNKIPEGFNNNLAWNLGHIVATQQLLCYGLSSLPMELENDFISSYRKGSKPEGDISQADLDFMKNQMIVLADKVEDDYANGIFKEYKEYATSFNATLSSVEDAILFNNMHETMHLGFMIALKKMV